MAHEYGTLAEFKEMRSISGTSQDQALMRALTRASRAIDRRCGRFFYRTGIPSGIAYAAAGNSVRSMNADRLIVPDIADPATISVTVGGSAVDGAALSFNVPAPGWPVTSITRASWYGGDIRITAEWGWPQVPEDIEQAALLLANRRYMRKDSPEGTSGWSQEGQVGVSRFDSDVEDLVAPFVLVGFGA